MAKASKSEFVQHSLFEVFPDLLKTAFSPKKTYYYKRSSESKKRHCAREVKKYWEKHKNDTITCVMCGKIVFRRDIKGSATKTCSVECSLKNKKLLDSKRDKQKRNEYNHSYYLQHTSQLIEYQRAYRKTPKGKEIMSRADSKEPRKIAKLMHRHAQRSITGITRKLTKDDIEFIMNMKTSCAYCGGVDDLCIDHIIPLARGGSNDLDNLQILCRVCNSSKNKKTMEEFLIYKQSIKNKL
jgi:5-methylcytosine-specific restriction endonuclease McrA